MGGYVIKKFTLGKGLKWLPAKLLLPFYPYSLSPVERVAREATFFAFSNLPTPNPIAVGKDYIVREYLEGEILGPKPKEIAEALKRVHSEGWALGDAKYDNFLVSGDKLYYIDGEQAYPLIREELAAADLIVASFFIMLKKGCRGVKEFWEAYPGEVPKRRALRSPGALLLLPCLHALL